jgi:hypothetical protein
MQKDAEPVSEAQQRAEVVVGKSRLLGGPGHICIVLR